ncbi:MAG: cyclic-phosphate processing receiver domain-containing protein [Chryseobacterium taeanense]
MQKAYSIFLDDIRVPSDVTWVKLPRKNYLIVRSYDLFVKTIKHKGLPEFITFDHDLSDQHYGHGLNNDEIKYDQYTEKTGYDCAKWLVSYCIDNNLDLPDYMAHSLNPVGSKNIVTYLERYSEVRKGK